MPGVKAALAAGVKVDACRQWTEIDYKVWGEKTWENNCDTALSMACSIGHLPLIKLLLSKGANPDHRVCNANEACDYTPACIARRHGHLTCADYMDHHVRRLHKARDVAREEESRQRHRQEGLALRTRAIQLRAAGPSSKDSGGDSLFLRAALNFKHGLGWSHTFGKDKTSCEAIDLKEFATFAILALELIVAKGPPPANRYGYHDAKHELEVLADLKAMPEFHGAQDTARRYELFCKEVATLRQEEAEQARIEGELKRVAAARRKAARERQRELEVARCSHIWPRRGWQDACTDLRCFTHDDMDSCTWGHEEHDLPPRCRWGTKCTFGDRCRFNHLK